VKHPESPVQKLLPDIKPVTNGNAESLRGSSVVAIGTMSNAQIAQVLQTAGQMQELVKSHGGDQSLKGKILASVFYEPSTRTNCSFQAAMLRLGGSVISVNESSSSVAKGETLADTVRCMECYSDVLVLRHPKAGAAAEAAAAMSKPLLNAGDGVGEHPTQALLDLYTIVDELSSDYGAKSAALEKDLAAALKGKVVTMVGDLKNGRTVHSLAKLLSRFEVTLRYVSPAELRMPAEVASIAAQNGCSHTDHSVLTPDILQETDILYVTRVQKERFETVEAYDAVKDAFIITPETLESMRPTARIMHPLPRVNEIDTRCDSDARAAYFRQMTNGMYVRMALLKLILG
jgi:carbamoyl-phosphate synthase/aspartate carbamoyltransferase/dihydroorotase